MINVVSNYFKEIPKFHFKWNNNYTVDKNTWDTEHMF